MVDPEAKETEQLENASFLVSNIGLLITLGQFLIFYFLSVGFGFFFDLINSQQSLAYLPILTVNNPGMVTFYLETLVTIVSFDPIPSDILFEIMPIWEFQFTQSSPNIESFERIGVEDRIFINVLGSLILFIFAYFGS